MKIAVISDLGATGGASIAATRLSAALRKRGHQVGRFHGARFAVSKDSADEFYPLAPRSRWPIRVWRVVKNETTRRMYQAAWIGEFRRALETFKPDLINLHNIHSYGWDFEIVNMLTEFGPVVWTLHDMWSVTGSCAYSFECQKFLTECDRGCPQIGVYPTLPASMIGNAHRRRKMFYADRPRVVHVAPSHWLACLAAGVTKGDIPTYHVDYGINLDQFCPANRAEARRKLNIAEDSVPTFLAGAASLKEPRKGISILYEALKDVEQPIRLLLLGGGAPVDIAHHGEAIFLGAVFSDDFLPLAYNAADVVVHPSLADNQPLVVQEAIACGKPVVALPVGGVPEMVMPGKTGWLAAEASAPALAGAMNRALEERAKWELYSRNCRRWAETRYSESLQAERYELVFQRLLEGKVLDQAELDSMERMGEVGVISKTAAD